MVANFSVREYITFVPLLSFATGLVFELPLLIYLVVRLGFVKLEPLRKNKKYVVLNAFTVATFITPTDLFSQAFMAIPLILLYWVSVSVVVSYTEVSTFTCKSLGMSANY